MPRYHSLGTEVQLCTWDPLSRRSIFKESSRSAAQTTSTDRHSTTGPRSEAPKGVSTFNGWASSSDHDRLCKVDRLTENYFERHEGLDFLGRDAPFFLIHAGNDSSNIKPSSQPWIGTNSSSCQGHKVFVESSDDLTVTPFSARSHITEKAVPATPYIESATNDGPQNQNGLIKVHSSSSLSSLSSSEFLSPHASNFRSGDPERETGDRTIGASFVTLKPSKKIADNTGLSSRAPKLEIVTKSIQVVVKLSEKSFTNPLPGAESEHCDICINIFYNGEFSTSQVIQYSAWVALENKSSFGFSGKRSGTGHELPWVITARSKDTDSTLLQINRGAKTMTPQERWNTLTEMLVLESNEWGRDERGHRCPTGEYLELLSKTAIPSELDGPQVSMENGFGVIDVIITLGHAFHHGAAKEISSPHRYLHTSQPGTAHIQSKLGTPSLARATESPKAPAGPQLFNRLRSSAIALEPGNTSGTLPTKEMSHAAAASSHHRDPIKSGVLGVAIPGLGVMNHKADPQAAVRRATSMSACNPTALAISPTSRPPHPHRPQNVPQKTYRGSEPILPLSPPSKRQKTANLFEELPFDLNTAAYMSTRARRSASMPFAQTPIKPEAETSLKRKRIVNQAKYTLSNTEASEASAAGTPLMPEKDKGSTPKTPECGGPLKKKPRSSNFNAKLSNRPQNLRRKNSAGKWIFPPTRKNSAGEWETPTKGGKFDTAEDLAGQVDGAVTEESEKMFQPVFIDSADQKLRNLVIGLDTTDQISPDGDNITLKEKMYSRSSAAKANRLAPTLGVMEIKKESFPPNSSSGQRNEVPFPVTPLKFVISPTRVAFRGVKSPPTPMNSSPNQGLLATSQPPLAKRAFKNYLRRMEEDATIAGFDGIAVSKQTRKRKTLRMNFFEGNLNSDGEIVGDECGTRRWLVRRCTTPENVPGPGSGNQLASFPLFENPKLKLSFLATGPKVEKVMDVLTDHATNISSRKSGTGDTAGLAGTNDSVIASLRDSRFGMPQQPKSPALTQPRPCSGIPNHNSRVLRLVNRRPVAKETDGMKQEAQGTNGQASGSNHATGEFGGDATNDSDGIDASGLPIPGKQTGSRHGSQHDTKLKASSMPRFDNIESTISSDESTMLLAQKKDITQSCDFEAQLAQEYDASTQMPPGRKIPKRPFRPRTVGSTELKALLESHDRHKVANTSLSASLGMTPSQPMTRASRNAISFKPHKVSGTSGINTDKAVSSDKRIVRRPIMSNSVPRKRSSSGQFVEKTKNGTVVPKLTENTDGGNSKVVDSQKSSIFHPSAYSLEVKTSSSGTPKTDASNVTNFKEAGEVDVALKQVCMANTEINKAAGDLESLTDCASAQRTMKKAVVVNTDRANASYDKKAEDSVTDMHGNQERNTPSSPVLAPGVNIWKPGCLCENSILRYAEHENWDHLERSPVTRQKCTRVWTQNEGCFKTFGILMGVRYVVVGSEVVKEW